jgi:NADH-quinone oxidoreductase subunit F
VVEKLLSRNWQRAQSHTLETYLASGGWELWKRTVRGQGMTPQEVIDAVKASGIRGMGGAGFPTGVKWGFLPKERVKPRYLVVNADEGEPGTFKDRYILELDPHMLLEGMALACFALDAHVAYVYVRGEFDLPTRRLEAAIDEARAAGLLGKDVLGSGFDLEIHAHRGAGAYVCGEETGLIESLEGKKGQPRLKPPFPAVVGVFASPTIVNNVETITAVPHILSRGPEAWRALGVNGGVGTKLYGISGHVERPGVYERPLGITIRELIDVAGGVRNGGKLKAVIPGGSSCALVMPADIDAPMEWEGIKRTGSTLGTGCATVMDDSVCMVRTLARMARFYAHESCGQCTPCREGVHWMAKILWRLEHGEGRAADVALLDEVAGNVMGNTICALGEAAAVPVRSFIKLFRAEFEQHARGGRCPFPTSYPVAPRQVTIGG